MSNLVSRTYYIYVIHEHLFDITYSFISWIRTYLWYIFVLNVHLFYLKLTFFTSYVFDNVASN